MLARSSLPLVPAFVALSAGKAGWGLGAGGGRGGLQRGCPLLLAVPAGPECSAVTRQLSRCPPGQNRSSQPTFPALPTPRPVSPTYSTTTPVARLLGQLPPGGRLRGAALPQPWWVARQGPAGRAFGVTARPAHLQQPARPLRPAPHPAPQPGSATRPGPSLTRVSRGLAEGVALLAATHASPPCTAGRALRRAQREGPCSLRSCRCRRCGAARGGPAASAASHIMRAGPSTPAGRVPDPREANSREPLLPWSDPHGARVVLGASGLARLPCCSQQGRHSGKRRLARCLGGSLATSNPGCPPAQSMAQARAWPRPAPAPSSWQPPWGNGAAGVAMRCGTAQTRASEAAGRGPSH